MGCNMSWPLRTRPRKGAWSRGRGQGLPQPHLGCETAAPGSQDTASPAQWWGLRRHSVQRGSGGEVSIRRPTRPGVAPWAEALPSSQKGPCLVASAIQGAQSSEPSGWASGLGSQRCAPASQVCREYLGSLASEASLEDDVGRGSLLLRSPALASEASAGAQKGWGAG